MNWLELAKNILQMPLTEMTKPVTVFDYNDEINKNADAITASGFEPWDLDIPKDFMIVFNSKNII